MSVFAQYVAVIMLHLSKTKKGEAYSGSFSGLSKSVSEATDSMVDDDDIRLALGVLEPFSGAKKFESPLTDGYWKIDFDNFRYYFIETSPDYSDDKDEYHRIRETVTHAFPILCTYAESGDTFAEDTIEYLRSTPSAEWEHLKESEIEENSSDAIPASDRAVKLTDNQSQHFVSKTNEIIEEVEKSTNSIDGDTDLRSRLLGQLKAARELFLSGVVRVELLKLTILDALNVLAEKYKDQVIGGLATALIVELMKIGF